MLEERFTQEQIRGLSETQEAREQLEVLGNFWIGPDIEIEKPTVIKPGQNLLNQNIVIKTTDLPPGVDLTRGAIGSLKVSVRSFFAQTGIEIVFAGANIPDKALAELKEKGSALAPVDIKNYSDRAVELSGRAMRFFWVNDRKRLRGNDLKTAVQNNGFLVEGEQGKDWFLGGYDQDEKILTSDPNSDKGLCVIVMLKSEKFYIPFSEEPIRRNENIPIREQLNSLLVPLTDEIEREFEIGETPKITLGEDILAVINTGIDRGGRHINSPLIDSGSDWKIRTEMIHGQNYLELFLYKK